MKHKTIFKSMNNRKPSSKNGRLLESNGHSQSSKNNDDEIRLDRDKTNSIEKSKRQGGFFSCFNRQQQPSKSTEPPLHQLKMFELYKFASRFDILFMFIGTIMCLGAGMMFPLMLWIYQGVTNKFIDIGVTSKPSHNFTVINFDPACIPQSSTNSSNSLFSEVRELMKWYVVLGFLSIFCYWIGFSLWMITAECQVQRMRFRLFRSMMNQEIGWFDMCNPGELSNRLVSDLDKIRDGLGNKCADLINLMARLIGGLVFAFVIGWKLALVFISVSPLIILSFNIMIRVIRKYTIKEVQAFSRASAIAQTVIGAIRTVTAFGGQKKEQDRFSVNLTEAKKIGIEKGIFLGLCQSFTQIAIYTAFSITLWYGPYLVRNECQNYSGGTVIVVFISCLQSTFSISQIVPNIQAFAEAVGSASFVFGLIDKVSKIDAFNNDGKKPKYVIGDIEFQDVSFSYPARKDMMILNMINMKIPAGKTLALVGASGCGKSTTIQLIQRFYDPDSGRILLDGEDIKTLNVAWLRSHIGVVSQEPVLFIGSIEENIRLGKSDATDNEVIAAAKMANAHDFIMELPDNYKTLFGDKLSGGQKQRVTIARALISNPKILLLDEATSALDNTSERVVQDALERAKEGRTTIVIAHRLSTIRNADRIIVLDKGKMVESGTHNELMDKNVNYSHQRTTSVTSATDVSVEMNDEEVVVTNSRFCCRSFIFEILRLNFPELNWIIVGCIASLIFGATTPLYALLFSNVYELFAEQDLNKANIQTRNLALLIFSVGVAGAICQFMSSIAFSKSGEELTMRMRMISFRSILRQEISWFDREENNVGALVTQLSSDTSSLKNLSGLLIGVIFNVVGAMICSLTIAFIAGWKLSFAVLLFFPLMVFSGILQARRMSNTKRNSTRSTKETSWSEKGGMIAIEAIDNIRTVVGLHQEQYFITRYEDYFNKAFRRSVITVQLQALGTALANSLMFFIHATAFGYGSYLVEHGEMEFQNVFRVFSVITFGAMSVGRSTAMIPNYTKGKASAIRVLKLINRQSRIDPENSNGIILSHIVGNVEFQQVKFTYPSRPELRVLKGLDLFASANQTTAFVGPSGSGKSTCVALILRFYDPYNGAVFLDGHDVRSLNISWLRSQLGFVEQEPVLFDLSIRDNIAYGDNTRTVTQEEIEAAARKANIHDLIVSLPNGYDTLCGSKGNQMSGGQKQRIAIARALIREPKLLLLDEATSALDVRSEKVVQDALNVAQNGRTCLTVAHRLSTIRDSEQIVVVDRGRVKENGTHDDLMCRKGAYYKLNMIQE